MSKYGSHQGHFLPSVLLPSGQVLWLPSGLGWKQIRVKLALGAAGGGAEGRGYIQFMCKYGRQHLLRAVL